MDAPVSDPKLSAEEAERDDVVSDPDEHGLSDDDEPCQGTGVLERALHGMEMDLSCDTGVPLFLPTRFCAWFHSTFGNCVMDVP